MGNDGHDRYVPSAHEKKIFALMSDNNRRRRRFHIERSKVREYGTVLVWHRWIDEELEAAIRSHFEPTTKGPADGLLNYPGGLSSFSARVHLGRCMGIYGPILYSDLKIVNDIRNDFAHPRPGGPDGGELEVLGFDHPEIVESIEKLRYPWATLSKKIWGTKPKSPEKIFVHSAHHIELALWSTQLPPPGDSPMKVDGKVP